MKNYLIIEETVSPCTRCGKDSSDGMILCWSTDQDENHFKYLQKGDQMHIECYIDLCVEKSLNKISDYDD